MKADYESIEDYLDAIDQKDAQLAGYVRERETKNIRSKQLSVEYPDYHNTPAEINDELDSLVFRLEHIDKDILKARRELNSLRGELLGLAWAEGKFPNFSIMVQGPNALREVFSSAVKRHDRAKKQPQPELVGAGSEL